MRIPAHVNKILTLRRCKDNKFFRLRKQITENFWKNKIFPVSLQTYYRPKIISRGDRHLSHRGVEVPDPSAPKIQYSPCDKESAQMSPSRGKGK